MDVHTDAIAVAYVAQDHGAEVMDLGVLGPRQWDMDPLIRTMPSKAKPLIFLYAAGPCGYWLYRYLMKTGYDCWVVAPSLLPHKPGDRGTTDRREAGPLARLARSGDLTAGAVPTVEAEAMRDLTRAREDTLSDLNDTTYRLTACLLRHDIGYTARSSVPFGKVRQRASAETQPRWGVTLGRVKRLGEETRAESEAGTRRRHGRWEPTHGEQQDHPSSVPGSGASDAPRKKSMQTSKNRLTALDIGSHSNTRCQARRRARARHERTLFAVACKPLFGSAGD
jgi:Transposase